MKFALTIIVLVYLAGCAAQQAMDTTRSKGNVGATAGTPVPADVPGELPAVDCRLPQGYDVFVVSQEKRTVNVTAGGKLLRAIDVPWHDDSRVSGFSLNWARKTKEGFEISIEYGSRYYYSKRLMFDCRNGGFYLTRIKVESFDKNRPEKWTDKTVSVKPMVPIDKFRVLDYTNQ